MSADLIAEAFAAAGRVREPHFRRMAALGVPRSALIRVGRKQPPFGLQPVQECPGGLFEPAEEGPLSIIIPVVEFPMIDFYGVDVETTEIIDLIAFRSNNPFRWLWRTGDGWALGSDLLRRDAPIPLVAT